MGQNPTLEVFGVLWTAKGDTDTTSQRPRINALVQIDYVVKLFNPKMLQGS
eukprot:NODE_11783_length_249_cov_114.895000_g10013_i0.p3 GENE.NODE_11783_length_249_cov_114.895000_g10013_i0~~NODE_11783_length_249_cov_114.895000_g10013_i0.p3  ORF type:complete len:51 (+),score=4.29 NODE_11783_length_249_cov_114.895000_g10013_i0:33-185(+)